MTTTEHTTPPNVVVERTTAFIAEPRRINPVLRAVIWAVERAIGQRFVPGRLVAWSPRTALQWVLVPGARPGKPLDRRMLQLVAITAACTADSPYCVAMNSEYLPTGLSPDEVEAVLRGADPSSIPTLTHRERVAVRYARLVSATPLRFPGEFVDELTDSFTEREIVALASTAASINYNARLIEALGVPAPVFPARPRQGR